MNSITLKMKVLKKTVSILIISLITISVANAQISPKNVFKNWTVLAESGNSIDVSYTIVKCENVVPQIHFSVFNESSSDQDINFRVVIKDDITNKSFSKDISLVTKKMNVYKANCDGDNFLTALKIDLPSNYNPDHLTLSISFK